MCSILQYKRNQITQKETDRLINGIVHQQMAFA